MFSQGDKVVLAAPSGKVEDFYIKIQNGAVGVVLGEGYTGAYLVEFEVERKVQGDRGLNRARGLEKVSVPATWLHAA
jgi:collagenase-like PrtC family protease